MVDWQELFVPVYPIPEIILRGTMTYIMLFLICDSSSNGNRV
jgi:hypothetical protein